MTSLPDLQHWADRLVALCPEFGGRIFVVIPDDELDIYEHESPCVFVYLDKESSENYLISDIKSRQKMAMDVAVQLVQRRTASRRDKYGIADSILQKQYRESIHKALFGWQPIDCDKFIVRASGSQKKEKDQLKFTDIFSTYYRISNGQKMQI